jgi:hypothetical protein
MLNALKALAVQRTAEEIMGGIAAPIITARIDELNKLEEEIKTTEQRLQADPSNAEGLGEYISSNLAWIAGWGGIAASVVARNIVAGLIASKVTKYL